MAARTHPTSFLLFSVLGFELRAYTLSYSTSPFVMDFFKIVSHELFAWVSNLYPPDLCLLSS
jgi:hypothetical protein